MRAYIMVTAKLQRPRTLASIKEKTGLDGLEVYGPYDAVVELEAETVEGMHRKVNEVDRLGIIQGTTTYVVAREGKAKRLKALPRTFAYVLIDAAPGGVEEVHKSVSELREVRKADIVFGPYDLVADVTVRDLKELGRVVREITGMDSVLRTCTLISVPRG